VWTPWKLRDLGGAATHGREDADGGVPPLPSLPRGVPSRVRYGGGWGTRRVGLLYLMIIYIFAITSGELEVVLPPTTHHHPRRYFVCALTNFRYTFIMRTVPR
jgi:hypothetical protein